MPGGSAIGFAKSMKEEMSKTIMPDILHLEACNFIDKPMGGQLTFSRQLMKVLGSRLALVGWASNASEPVGSWFDKEIDGTVYRYFAFERDRTTAGKPVIPARIKTLLQIRRYMSRILSIGISNVIIEEHSILMAINLGAKDNLCYCFPGVEAPLTISKYPFVKNFAAFFDYYFFKALRQKAKCVLAAGDEVAIAELYQRAGKQMKGINVIPFPTRVDTDIFHPAEGSFARKKLGLPPDAIIVVTIGRIHWAKGWPFLLESFKLFLDQHPGSSLIFIGDGVEREALEQQTLILGLQDNVIVAGYQAPSVIASYLQASDLFVMGSFKEGWSTVLVEALACHVPIVTTRFSSADTIVKQGVNGFVVDGRNPYEFSKVMEAALHLPETALYADSVIDRYALANLTHDLFQFWPLI